MGRTRTNYGSPITINTHVGEKYSIINVLQPLPYRVLLLLLVNVDLKSLHFAAFAGDLKRTS